MTPPWSKKMTNWAVYFDRVASLDPPGTKHVQRRPKDTKISEKNTSKLQKSMTKHQNIENHPHWILSHFAKTKQTITRPTKPTRHTKQNKTPDPPNQLNKARRNARSDWIIIIRNHRVVYNTVAKIARGIFVNFHVSSSVARAFQVGAHDGLHSWQKPCASPIICIQLICFLAHAEVALVTLQA